MAACAPSTQGSSEINLVISASDQPRTVRVRKFPREPSAIANLGMLSPFGVSTMRKVKLARGQKDLLNLDVELLRQIACRLGTLRRFLYRADSLVGPSPVMMNVGMDCLLSSKKYLVLRWVAFHCLVAVAACSWILRFWPSPLLP